MKIGILFLLIFVFACNGESPQKPTYSSPVSGEMTALEHIKKARQMLRNEEGHLMVMGRSHTEEEKERYETLLFAGKSLSEVIDRLEKSDSN